MNVNKLLNGDGGFGSSLGDRSNPVYLYSEVRLGKKETDGIYSRTCAALKDSFGYAKSVIVWGIYDRQYFRTLQGKKTGKEEKFTEVDCRNITDVVKFCSDYRVVADEDKQFLCSLGFVEMVRVFSEKDADRLIQVRKGIKDYEMLYRLVIQTINPAADISLITDPKDPNYAMDGESIGLLVNVAFCAFRCVFDSERDKMYKDGTPTSTLIREYVRPLWPTCCSSRSKATTRILTCTSSSSAKGTGSPRRTNGSLTARTTTVRTTLGNPVPTTRTSP